MSQPKKNPDIPEDMKDYEGDISDDELFALLEDDTSEGAVDEEKEVIKMGRASANKISKKDLMNLLDEDTSEGAED